MKNQKTEIRLTLENGTVSVVSAGNISCVPCDENRFFDFARELAIANGLNRIFQTGNIIELCK